MTALWTDSTASIVRRDRQAAEAPRADGRFQLVVQKRYALNVDLLDQQSRAAADVFVQHVEGRHEPLETELGQALAGRLANHGVGTLDQFHQTGQHAGDAATAKLRNDVGLHLGVGIGQGAHRQGVGVGPLELAQSAGRLAPSAGLAVQEDRLDHSQGLLPRNARRHHETHGRMLARVVDLVHDPAAIAQPGDGGHLLQVQRHGGRRFAADLAQQVVDEARVAASRRSRSRWPRGRADRPENSRAAAGPPAADTWTARRSRRPAPDDGDCRRSAAAWRCRGRPAAGSSRSPRGAGAGCSDGPTTPDCRAHSGGSSAGRGDRQGRGRPPALRRGPPPVPARSGPPVRNWAAPNSPGR